MAKTAQQIAGLHFQTPECQRWLFDPATPTSELHQFIHLTGFKDYGGHSRTIFELTRTILDVRISEDAAKSVEKLTRQTDRLTVKVADLVLIAEEQKKLAAKLEKQTNKLICLTWGLVGFSVVLLAIAFVQTKIMLKENPQANVQHVQTSQSDQQPSTNK